MRSYRDLLSYVLECGTAIPSRAVLKSTGERVGTISVFGLQWQHDLSTGFPLLTTKRVHWKSVAVELGWFLGGSLDIEYMRSRGVTIWDEWRHPQTGDLGPVYGAQWRFWQGPDGGEFDQIETIVRGIQEVASDPESSVRRRLILSAWAVHDLHHMALPPCHLLSQFDVRGGRLSCQVYMRSCDAFLGLPFNIASYALLTHLLAHATGLVVGELIFTFGDLHIYENHTDQVAEQLSRQPKSLPTLNLADYPRSGMETIEAFVADPTRAYATGYNPHPAIPAEVAV